jgi:hypothetical protein
MRGKIVTLGSKLALASATALGLLCGTARPVLADASDSNVAKGLVGGAILGGEAVLLTESALRLDRGWMYLAGGAAGTAGGAYLGYRIGKGSSNKPPAFLLAGGIALLIPTIMGVLTATQYTLPDSYRVDDAGGDDAPMPDAPTPDAGARLTLPNVGLAQAFSRDELARHRVKQATELHLMLLRGVF